MNQPFTNPFRYEPHPLVREAARLVMERLDRLISDGTLLKTNLKLAGRDDTWLDKVLRARDATVGSTWLLTVDHNDRILWYPREECP